MTNLELQNCRPGTVLLYHGQKCKLRHVKSVRHNELMVYAKITIGNSMLYMVNASELEFPHGVL